MTLLLDTCILGKICHPKRLEHGPMVARLQQRLAREPGLVVYVPEIADYELRRKYLHRDMTRSLKRLREMSAKLGYLPLSTKIMQHAAELWAQARKNGTPTAAEDALDGDVILAAQALSVHGTVVTTNVKHLSLFVAVEDWT